MPKIVPVTCHGKAFKLRMASHHIGTMKRQVPRRELEPTHMKNNDIDTSDIPELTEDFWKNARLRYPSETKKQLTVKLDGDMVQWFRAQDEDYQSK